MKKDPTIFLHHIVESIAAIDAYTTNLSEEVFLADQKTQDAVVRRLEVIGEAARNLPEETRQLASAVAWRQLMAMRNILIHEYFGVDLKLVWRVVQKDLPSLKQHINEILNAAS